MPTLRERFREAYRAYWQGPRYTGDPALKEFFGSGTTSATGISVTESTSLNYSAVWAAVNTISGDIAALPLKLWKREPDGLGKTPFPNHPLYRILHEQPNEEMTSVVWRKTMQAHVLTWGNAYSEIVRNGGARVAGLYPLTPDRVTPFRRSADSRLQYRIVEPGGGESYIDDVDMIHISGLGYTGTCGYDVIGKARESLGLLAAAERFGGSFFGNGSTFGGVLSFPMPRPPEMAEKNFREQFNMQHQGVDRAHKFLALYGGATYQQIGIAPNAAQFLETRQFQVSEIARWFNLPPHKIGDYTHATYSNIEQMTQDYVTNTLMPWLAVWEQELIVKLIPNSERNIQVIEHVLDGLLRGDTSARGTFYNQQAQVAAITPNEIRALENRNPIPGGDRAFVNKGVIALDKYDEWIDAEIAATKAKAVADSRPPTPPADTTKVRELEQIVQSLNVELELARRKAQEAEDAKDRIAQELDGTRVEWLKAQKALEDEVVARAKAEDAYRSEMESRQHDAERERLTRQALAADYVSIQERAGELQMSLTAVEAERDALKISGEALAADVTRLMSHVDELVQDVAEAKREVEAAAHGAVTSSAVITELRAQLATVTGEAADLTGQILEAREALVRSQTEHAAQGQLLEAAKAETAEKLGELLALQDRTIQTQIALRGVLKDAVERLIARETDRARKAAGSPDKLAKWVDNFYPMHEDVCRTNLRPAVRAWLIASGNEASVDRVLDQLVVAYLGESTRQLRGVLAEADQESLMAVLEKVLRRWEATRAEATVDRLLNEAA